MFDASARASTENELWMCLLTHVSRPNSAATRSHSIASVTFLAVPSPWLIIVISGFRIGFTALCDTVALAEAEGQSLILWGSECMHILLH
jgi:hypothetical protein